jgi:hypothetical protein
MAFCQDCGGPLDAGQKFCPNCGATAEGSDPTPDPAAVYGRLTYRGIEVPPRAKERGKGLWVALAALVVLIAIACILVFVVFKDDVFGLGPGDTPEKTADALLKTVGRGKVENVFDFLEPYELQAQLGGLPVKAAKEMMKAAMPSQPKAKYKGVRMQTTYEDSTHAFVRLVGGTMTVKQGGVNLKQDLGMLQGPDGLRMVKSNGKWYLDLEWMDTMSKELMGPMGPG